MKKCDKISKLISLTQTGNLSDAKTQEAIKELVRQLKEAGGSLFVHVESPERKKRH